MPTVIVPVGLVMGPEFGADGPADRDPEYWEVHLGAVSQELTTTEFSVWAAAFADPPMHAELAFGRQQLVQQLAQEEEGLVGAIADAGPVVDDLLDRGLLLEFDPVDGSLDAPFGRLRLLPQGRGLGIAPDEPQRYRIAFADVELVQVDAVVYRLWSYSMRYSSLWAACADMATQDASAQELARRLAGALPALVSAGAAFLDPVDDEVTAGRGGNR